MKLFLVQSTIKFKEYIYYPGTLLLAESSDLITNLNCFLQEEKKIRLNLIDGKSIETDPYQVEEIVLKRSKFCLEDVK